MRQKVFHSLKKTRKGISYHMQPAGTWDNAQEEKPTPTYRQSEGYYETIFQYFGK